MAHKHHKPLYHKLTAAQKQRRRERLRRLGKVLLWLVPETAIVMAGKLIADRIKQNKAKKQSSPAVNNVLLGLQKLIAQQVAMAGNASISKEQILQSPDPIGATMATLFASSQKTLENVADDATDPSVGGIGAAVEMAESNHPSVGGIGAIVGGIGAAVHTAESNQSNDNGQAATINALSSAISLAQQKASQLSGVDKTDALAQINALQDEIYGHLSNAKQALKVADPTDVQDVSTALSKVSKTGVAASLQDVQTDTPILKTTDEKKALGEPMPLIPKWGWWVIGGATVATIGYFAFAHGKHKK